MAELNPKNLLFNSLFYTVGLITSITATKFSDELFPNNDPVVIKKVVDTMRVVHEYLNNNPTVAVVENPPVQASMAFSQAHKNIEVHYNKLENIHKVMPKMKGLVEVDESSHFIFHCPKVKKTEDYIDLQLEFYDNNLVEQAACIYLVASATTHSKNALTGTISDKQTTKYAQAYKIKKGKNTIKLRNYFKNSETTLEVGYLSKSDTIKKYPVFEKITCTY